MTTSLNSLLSFCTTVSYVFVHLKDALVFLFVNVIYAYCDIFYEATCTVIMQQYHTVFICHTLAMCSQQ